MHSYRSLMMVAGMAGVMVVMAGVLLNTEQMARRQEKAPSAARAGDWVPLGARRRPDDPTAFDRCLDRIRLLTETPGADPTGGELARQIEQAAVLADAAVYPRIAALLDDEGLEPRLESAALVLAGASGAPEAASLLVSRYPRRPLGALQGLARLGGEAAFEAIAELFAAETGCEARRSLLEAAMVIDPRRTIAELLGPLTTGSKPGRELEVVLALLGETGLPEAVVVLESCLRAGPDPDRRLLRAGTAGLAALADQGGREVLAELVADEAVPAGLRRAAGEALAALPGLGR